MFPKRLALWCAAFLSLSLTVLASVPSEGKEETRPAVEEVRAIQPPPYTGPTTTHQDLANDIARAVWIKSENDKAFFAELARQTAKQNPKGSVSREARYGTGACGPGAYTAPDGTVMDLPPCRIMGIESGGNINAYNPTGCNGRGCYGKWQCDPRSCDGTGSEYEQDGEAARLWQNGAGCSHWAAC